MDKVLKYIFHISILFLIIISLWPGSLLGYLLYGDWGSQPDLIKNPFGTTINHFIYYLYVSTLGFFIYLKTPNLKKIRYIERKFFSEYLDLPKTLEPYIARLLPFL